MDMLVVAVIILCIWRDFHFEIFNLFARDFHQGINLHIIYFSLNDINIGLR